MEKTKEMSKIGGYAYQKEEAMKIINFFKNYDAFTQNGASLPRGVLFYGEPGNGKTLFANAIAKDSGANTYYLTDNLYMQDNKSVSKELVNLFKEATKNAPSIVILDEIDQLIEASGGFGRASDSEKEVLRVLLTEIDKLENKGVLVIATGNVEIEGMPDALVRNGRLEKHIYIGAPDFSDRTDILHMFLNKNPIFSKVKAKEIAKLTQDLTCSSLKTLVNDVLIKCVSNNFHKATYQDFHDPLQVIVSHGIKRKSPKNIDDVVYHELGHLVSDFIINGKIGFVSIESYGNSAGRYKSFSSFAEEQQDLENNPKTLEDFNNTNIVLISGLAATEVFLGEKYTGASSDLVKIRKVYEIMSQNGLLSFGEFIESTSSSSAPTPFNTSRPQINRDKFEEYLKNIYQNAVDLLKEHKTLVETLFVALKKKKTLTSEEVEEIILGMEEIPHSCEKEEIKG